MRYNRLWDLGGCTLVKQGTSAEHDSGHRLTQTAQRCLFSVFFFSPYLRLEWRRNRPCVPHSDSITSMARGRGWWCKLLCNITGPEHSNEIIILYGSARKHCNLGSGFIHNCFVSLLTSIFLTDGLNSDHSHLSSSFNHVFVLFFSFSKMFLICRLEIN